MPKIPAPPERLEAVSLEELCLRLVRTDPNSYDPHVVVAVETEIRRRIQAARAAGAEFERHYPYHEDMGR